MLKRLADWEEYIVHEIIERVAERQPKHFWDDEPIRGIALDARFLKYWPHFLSFGYWWYLFGNLKKGHYGGYHAEGWIKLSALSRIFEETQTERLICRWRGHPEGEVYWNPGGDEPDHHCRTCGENIG